MESRIWISLPDPTHKSFGLQIFMPDQPEKVAEFEALCLKLLINNRENAHFLGTFFQGGHNEQTWKYFEFLATGPDTSSEDQGKIVDLCLQISEQLDLELEIDMM